MVFKKRGIDEKEARQRVVLKLRLGKTNLICDVVPSYK